MKKLILFSFLLLIGICTSAQISSFVVTASGTSVSCYGQCNASAYAMVSGGVGPFSYYWSGPNGFTAVGQIQNNLCSGNYVAYAIDSSNMSTVSHSISISQPSQIYAQANTNVSTCVGSCANLYVAASGGTPPYMYNWTPSIGLSSTSVANPLACPSATTTYMVSITDANGCATINNTSAYVAVVVSPQLTINTTTSPSTCGQCNGSAVATTSAGSIATSYSWNGPQGNISTVANPSNLCAGTYTIIATTSTGCSGAATTIVSSTSSITSASVTTTPSSCASTGSITISNIVGGNPPYYYNLNGTATYTTSTISGLTAGTYQLVIYSANQCSYSTSVTIQSSSGISILVDTVHATGCSSSSNTGFAYVHAIGGTPSYTYVWTPGGQIGPALTNAVAGTYYVEATDNIGCTTYQPVIIPAGSLPTLVLDSLVNINCQSASFGSIAVNGNGGISPYTYSIDGGVTFQSSGYFSGLTFGTYTLIVKDVNGCIGSHTYQIQNNGTLFLATTCTFANCGNNGTANVIATGGVPPYSYTWSNGQTIGTSSNVGNLQGTTLYNVTVTDASGCSATGNVYVYNLCYNVIHGTIYNDLNGNCVRDTGEPGVNTSVYATNGTNYTGYGYSYNSDGNYSIYTSNLNNEIHLGYLPLYNVQSCPPSPATQTANFTAMGDTINNVDFAIQTLSNINDLKIFYYPGNARPGFSQSTYLYYYNVGTTTINNAVITVTHDSILTYSGSSPSPSNYSYPYITYNIGTIAPGAGGYIYPTFTIPTIGNGGYIGRVLHYSATITPVVSDYTPADNTYSSTRIITNSYDPNEKDVSPAGDITSSDSLLTYTIQFQNTGNDTAFTVVVKDTLSPYLDIASVQPKIASHHYTFDMSFNGVLTFRFDNILLVDSTTNELGSHGFVTYTVRPKASNPIGTTIENTAYIYFDFNDAIVTNTVHTMLADPTGIKENDATGNISVYPNPFTEQTSFVINSYKNNSTYQFELMDVLGKKVLERKNITTNHFTINRNTLENGIYFYKIISSEKIIGLGKVIIK